jgi:hypothetical protein
MSEAQLSLLARSKAQVRAAEKDCERRGFSWWKQVPRASTSIRHDESQRFATKRMNIK